MYPPSRPVNVPKSYTNLPGIDHISVYHVPESAPEATQVLVVKLNRPAKNNAFTGPMLESLAHLYEIINADERVKCIVMTGQGKMFCAGADLEIGFVPVRGSHLDNYTDRDHRDGGGRVSMAMHRCRVPTIVALNGHAVGVGITMILPAAIRIAYSKAKVGFVFARRGLPMEAGSAFFLPKLIGHGRALHICTTGDVYPATHPLLSGLFSETVDTPEATVTRALELANEIAIKTSGVSTKINRDLIWRAPGSAEETHLLDSRLIHGMIDSEDNTEGIKSFMEKRPANFKGRDFPQVWPWWPQVDIGYKPPASKGLSKI